MGPGPPNLRSSSFQSQEQRTCDSVTHGQKSERKPRGDGWGRWDAVDMSGAVGGWCEDSLHVHWPWSQEVAGKEEAM